MSHPFPEALDPALLPLVIVEVELEILLLAPPPTRSNSSPRPSRSRSRPVADKQDFARRWDAIWPGANAAKLMKAVQKV